MGNMNCPACNSEFLIEMRLLTNTFEKIKKLPTGEYDAKTDVQKVVLAYKIAKGVDRQNRIWDKINYARNVRPATTLLEIFGGRLEQAVDYLLKRGEELDLKKLEWNLETIVRNASNKGENYAAGN